MTQTTNIGLKKIDGSENWRQIFDYHNDSMDKADSSVAAVQDGLAIVANGNTHAAVAEGQFVYVRNHSTLAEGLYKATDAIATNGELTTSNLTADGSGGLNDLQGQVDSLNSKITTLYNGNAVNAINANLNTYHTLIFVMSDYRHVSITQDAVPNSTHYGMCSFLASDAIPIVIQNICFVVNDSATGIYIDSTRSKQININSDATIGVYQASDLTFTEVYGISK